LPSLKPTPSMKRIAMALFGVVCLAAVASAEAPSKKKAETTDGGTVATLSYAGPYEVRKPFMVDDVDVNGEAFDAKSVLASPLSLDAAFAEGAQTLTAQGGRFSIPTAKNGGYAVSLLGIRFSTKSFGAVEVKVEGLDDSEIYIDGEKASSSVLRPGTHEAVVKCLGGDAAIRLEAEESVGLELGGDAAEGGRLYTLRDVMEGIHCTSVGLSRSGKYLIIGYSTTFEGGKTTHSQKLVELSSGKVLDEGDGNGWQWLHKEDKYYEISGGEMVVMDPATGEKEVRASGLPEGFSMLSPTDDFLIYTLTKEGPAEREDVYEIVDPEDRQPGWRTRSHLAKYDLSGGALQPLTYGYHNAYAIDMTRDGKRLLFGVSRQQTARPTSVQDIYEMDLETLQAEKLVDGDGFVDLAKYCTQSGDKILFLGGPEAFGGVGAKVLDWQTPSSVDRQIFLMDRATKVVRSLTKDFDPSVESLDADLEGGDIFLRAENKDSVSVYRLDSRTWEISMVDLPEEVVQRISLARGAPVMAFRGQGSMNSDRVYSVDLRSGKVSLVEDLSAKLLEGVTLGECHGWNFVDADGYTIYGRYYLPPHFDESKKYPLIVNYYGGCSPTGRDFESRYPWHLYAAMGYVVYVINPRGATGFGQKFSAYHVNTAGDYVADDIIEGTKKFVAEHPYVDGGKIGCIGASYGGFMTQWLQTKTDIFAAAISHAGISDHTSYWGNGYWGYSYSEVSMANSYPWSDKELFVDNSPLFNADKIHTPLLFLHGDADHNVPFMESVQMFTALKLLGRPTAFVAVQDQDHHIVDYDKRMRWQDTIFAWFQKWLKDDPSWWESLYPAKNL